MRLVLNMFSDYVQTYRQLTASLGTKEVAIGERWPLWCNMT